MLRSLVLSVAILAYATGIIRVICPRLCVAVTHLMCTDLTKLVVRKLLCGWTSLGRRIRDFLDLLAWEPLIGRAVDYRANVIGIIWVVVVLIATAGVAAIPIADNRWGTRWDDITRCR